MPPNHVEWPVRRHSMRGQTSRLSTTCSPSRPQRPRSPRRARPPRWQPAASVPRNHRRPTEIRHHRNRMTNRSRIATRRPRPPHRPPRPTRNPILPATSRHKRSTRPRLRRKLWQPPRRGSPSRNRIERQPIPLPILRSPNTGRVHRHITSRRPVPSRRPTNSRPRQQRSRRSRQGWW